MQLTPKVNFLLLFVHLRKFKIILCCLSCIHAIILYTVRPKSLSVWFYFVSLLMRRKSSTVFFMYQQNPGDRNLYCWWGFLFQALETWILLRDLSQRVSFWHVVEPDRSLPETGRKKESSHSRLTVKEWQTLLWYQKDWARTSCWTWITSGTLGSILNYPLYESGQQL